MLADVRAAFAFLTTLPLSHLGGRSPGRSFAYFPLVGLTIGIALTAVSHWAPFDRDLNAFCALLLWVALTGGLHLDGFSDCCDALFVCAPPETRRRILKDPRVGAWGAVGLCLLLLGKWLALRAVPPEYIVLAPVLGRWALVIAAARFPSVNEAEGSMGATWREGLGKRQLLIASATVLLLVTQPEIAALCLLIVAASVGSGSWAAAVGQRADWAAASAAMFMAPSAKSVSCSACWRWFGSMAKRLIFLLGGARSGKSYYAENWARERGGRTLFVATALPQDDDMRWRIAEHRKSRPRDWQTLEAPTDTAAAIESCVSAHDTVILDCLTLLTSNILLRLPESAQQAEANAAVLAEMDRLLAAQARSDATWLVVSNEVGMGIVPSTRLGFLFRNMLGRANQRIAEAADEVQLLVAGIAWRLK